MAWQITHHKLSSHMPCLTGLRDKTRTTITPAPLRRHFHL